MASGRSRLSGAGSVMRGRSEADVPDPGGSHPEREDPMPESHRFIVDRHEGDLAVVEVDGGSTLDVPRWLLPPAGRPDDVLLVSVGAGADRTVVTIVRALAAAGRAPAAAPPA